MRTTVAARWTLLGLVWVLTGAAAQTGAAGVAGSVALPRHDLPADMASLVPPDALALLMLQSSAAAAADLAAFQPRADLGKPLDPATLLLGPIGIAGTRVDPHRPLAVALSLASSAPGAPYSPMTGPPIVTYVLPVIDLDGLKLDLAGGAAGASTVVVSGMYVGVSLLPGYAPAAPVSDLARGLPDRNIVLRLRAARVIEAFRPFIDMGVAGLRAHSTGLNRPGGGDASPELVAQLQASQEMQAAMLERMVQALSLVPMADLALDQSDGLMELDCALQMLPGARRALGLPAAGSELVELARCLPAGFPVLGIFGMDVGALAETYGPFYRSLAAMPASSTASMGMNPARAEACVELLRTTGPHMSVAATWTDEGLSAVSVFGSTDPQGFVDTWRAAVESGPLAGFSETVAKGPKVEGRQTVRYTMNVDTAALATMAAQTSPTESTTTAAEEQAQLWRALLGKEGITAYHATLDDKVVTAIGPDTKLLRSTLKALKRGKGDLPAPLEALDAAARAQLCLWAQVGLREALLPVLEIVHETHPDPELGATLASLRALSPAPLSALVFASDDALEGSCRLDIAGVRQMLESFPHPKRSQGSAQPPGD